jgi:hypothetical protein
LELVDRVEVAGRNGERDESEQETTEAGRVAGERVDLGR